MDMLVEVLNEFGYHDTHKPGEKIRVKLKHLNHLIKEGYVKIVINNIGNNLDYDEDELNIEPFETIEWSEKSANLRNDVCKIQIRGGKNETIQNS